MFFITGLQSGGAEKQVITDANGLAASGYDVAVTYADEGELKNYLNKEVRLYRVSRGWYALFMLFRLLKNIRFDIILCNSPWTFSAIFIPALLTGNRWVMFMHGMNFWRKGIRLCLFRLSARFATKVVVTSEASRWRRINREKISPEKLVKLYNSFSNSSDVTGISRVIRKAGGRDKLFTIGCVARFDQVKQLHLFTDICELILQSGFRNFRIVLVGKGDTWEAINANIRLKGLESYFELPGYVDNLYDYYGRFSVFVLPSTIEDLSVSLLEASSSALPCIAFDVGGNSEIIHNEITGWIIPPYNVGLMAEKILLAGYNPSMLDSMGVAAAERVAGYFSPDARLGSLKRFIDNDFLP